MRGTALNEQARGDEAVPVLQKATKAAPDDAEASLQLAIAYNAVERWQQAQQAAEKALRLFEEGEGDGAAGEGGAGLQGARARLQGARRRPRGDRRRT